MTQTISRTSFEFRELSNTLDSRAPYGYDYYRIVTLVPVAGQMDSREPGGPPPPVNQPPVFVYPSNPGETIILSTEETGTLVRTIKATDPEGKNVTYSVETGSMPSWLTFNGSTGQIFVNGILIDGQTSGPISFRATDLDGEYSVSNQVAFSVDFPAGLTWTTVPNISFLNNGEEQRFSLSPYRPSELPNLTGNSLPTGVTIDDVADELVYDGTSGTVDTYTGVSVTASNT